MPSASATFVDAASREAPFRRGLHVFAVCLALCTLGLIAAGGMVTSTDSGLSVPDWPTTYGYNMFTFPPSKWVGGIFYEHGHRLIASTVGFLTIILAVWLRLKEPRRWLRRLGAVALLVVILQGILGGLTVRYLLPTWISVFHACLAQTFLCIVISIAVFTSRWWMETRHAVPATLSPAISAWCLAAVIVVFMQLVLGALMRHTGSGLAVPDFPLAYSQWLPTLSDDAIASYNRLRAFEYYLPEVTRSQVLIHLLHRAGAVLVTLVLLVAVISALRARSAPLRRFAWLIAILLAAQITLGAATVLTGKLPIIATAHVAVGAALLGACWVQALRSRALARPHAAHVPVRATVPALAGVAS